MHRSRELIKEITGYSRSSGQNILIVPGGSLFADVVRKVKASQEASHWMAILGMEQYGYYLADGSDAELVDDLNPPDGTCILLPYNLMKKKDELPHSWGVTSDTIAAWVALHLKARFIKATDVDGVYINGMHEQEIHASVLMGKETCVDAELPNFLVKNKMNCEVVNGNCPGRLINALRGHAPGTLIKG